jgi:hypothetical protein
LFCVEKDDENDDGYIYKWYIKKKNKYIDEKYNGKDINIIFDRCCEEVEEMCIFYKNKNELHYYYMMNC